MRALLVQHDHVTASGPVGDRLRERGFEIDEIMVVTEENFENPNVNFEFPDVSGYDLVVPMGAPWGAWDDGCIGKWLTPELEWVRSTIEADIPVLGICFGGQLIARALGGTVARGAQSEIGWKTIYSDDTSLVSNGPWFQFHYDQWTMPEGAVEIARNPIAPQAFTYGRSLAVQFHPELNSAILEGWLDQGGINEVIASGQNPEIMIAQTRDEEGRAAERTAALVDAFLGRVAKLV
ncbi:type 1 glutamine amidotransferase [Salinibacterium sp. SWN1162]|uniref:type 1 glutamine amidotransferase n=1 Tax=Salinibacterium sp. SWN1162 TaxID=2792053 RepID=UPI0018CDFC99|nr:type 1 glutamine amidotransferase [Salinibacterium sp. SWN1162]MBH0010021.1 type 1 glutamine amidotransferase [Salinibacterium sp. SWN1162]